MSYGTVQAEKMTTESGYSLGAGNASSFKNRIINGGMVIDQRNAGASVSTPTTASGVYTLDRWAYYVSQASKITIQQNAGSVTPPSGFTNYLGCTVSSSATVGATDFFVVQQKIEGFNIADFGWGTANAKSVTLSAWVYSSLTGTFSGAIANSNQSWNYPFTFNIASANTWTQISVTIPAQTSGSWNLGTNGVGIWMYFALGMGSNFINSGNTWYNSSIYAASGMVQVVQTGGATFYFTGVQIELGTVATSFDFRSYGTELALCQRYFTAINNGTGNSAYGPFGLCRNSLTVCLSSPLPVPMRTTPSASFSIGSGTNVLKQDGATYPVSSMVSAGLSINQIGFETVIGTSSLSTTGCAGFYGGSFTILASAEL